MKGTIELKKAIMINGKEVRELPYDTEKITPPLYMKALNYAVAKGNGITGSNVYVDGGAQMAIGMYAVIAEKPEYDITDIERVAGTDLMQFVNIGVGFTSGREDQTEEPSDQRSEDTQEPITQTFVD